MDIQLTHTINPYNIYCPVFTFERFCMFVNFYQSFYQKVVTYLSIGPTRHFNNHVVQVTFIKKDVMISSKIKNRFPSSNEADIRFLEVPKKATIYL